MPKREIDKYFDIYEEQENILFQAKQREDIRLNLALLKDNKPYNISSSSKVEFTLLLPNKTTETIQNITVLGNDLVINIPNRIIAEEGIYFGEISITDNEGNIKIPTLYFEIEKSLKPEPTLNYILKDSANNILHDIENFTLTVIS